MNDLKEKKSKAKADASPQLKPLLGARGKQSSLNLPQLKSAAELYKHELKDMLKGEIRTIGLRKKLAKRVITLNKLINVLDEHTE